MTDDQRHDAAPVEAGLAEREAMCQRLLARYTVTHDRYAMSEWSEEKLVNPDGASAVILIRALSAHLESQSAEIARLLTADRENTELLEAAIEGQSYWQARVERLEQILRRIEPHIDAIVCYASSTDEHEPNKLAVDLHSALADAQPTQGEGK